MKASKPTLGHALYHPRGMTLIELTVVILVLLSLISVLMIGAAAWKSGSDRANCILNIGNVQKAARSYQNVNALSEGDAFDSSMVIGPDSYVFTMPQCKSDGSSYSFASTIPAIGGLFMTCNISDHAPQHTENW